MGSKAAQSITSGISNTIIGGLAGDALTDADFNVVVGRGTLTTDTLGSRTVAVGYEALGAQNFTTATDSLNTAVGFQAGANITTGVKNVLVGANAGDHLTDADFNVAIGYLALDADTLGSKSTAIGLQALTTQNFTTATDAFNTAVGFQSGMSVTTGYQNTLIGGVAGSSLTVGIENVAIGYGALDADLNGSGNVAIGVSALTSQEASGTTANNFYNVAVGRSAGTSVSTGYYNTLIGGLAGDHVTTGQNNVVIGFNTDTSSATVSQAIVIGAAVTGAANTVTFGSSTNKITSTFTGTPNWAHSSDERLKKNIQEVPIGLAFINDLRPVIYNWKGNHELDSSDKELEHLYKENAEDNVFDTTTTQWGFVAQEIKSALDKAGVDDWDGWSTDEHGVQRLAHTALIEPLVKAVQELAAEVEKLKSGG